MNDEPTTPRSRVLVLGVGAVERGDDGIGPHVARHLVDAAEESVEVNELRGEAIELIDAWAGADAVIIVDAMRSGVAPGTIRRCDASTTPLPAELRAASTHDLGVADAIELARAMGSLPARVVVLAIEGETFTHGPTLSASVRERIPEIVAAVRAEVTRVRAERKERRVDA